MKRFDWTSFLRQHPLLSAIDARHLDWLLGEQASTEHRFEAGELIVREGDIGDSIFLIGSGSVEAVLSTAADETVVLSTMHGGDTFGEMGLFERHPRSASVRAREACVILEVRGDSLRRIAQTLPDIEFKVLLKVSERLRSKNEQILALHLKGSESASRAKDEVILECAAAGDAKGYYDVIAAEGDRRRICGLPPTYLTLEVVKPRRGKLLHYQQFVHPQGEESVSFASMAFES